MEFHAMPDETGRRCRELTMASTGVGSLAAIARHFTTPESAAHSIANSAFHSGAAVAAASFAASEMRRPREPANPPPQLTITVPGRGRTSRSRRQRSAHNMPVPSRPVAPAPPRTLPQTPARDAAHEGLLRQQRRELLGTAEGSLARARTRLQNAQRSGASSRDIRGLQDIIRLKKEQIRKLKESLGIRS